MADAKSSSELSSRRVKRKKLPSGTKLNILHFNDVYEMDKAPRFAAVLKEARNYLEETNPETDTICLFSGDFLSPSPVSTMTRGKHMITLLNSFGIDFACLGNHELDFGLEHATTILRQCSFPMLNANILVGRLPSDLTAESLYSSDTDIAVHRKYISQLMCECTPFITQILPKSGLKIGVFSVSEDWTHLLPISLDEGCRVLDPTSTARTLSRILRSEPHCCDMVILLTHSRIANDQELCESLSREAGVDFVAGGHDHCDHSQLINDSTVLFKSGTDFECLSIIEIDTDLDSIFMNTLPPMLSMLDLQQYIYTVYDSGLRFRHNLLSFDSDSDWAKKITPDAETEALRLQLSAGLEQSMSELIGCVHTDLDCTKEGVRTRECNAGNLVADVVRAALKVDIVQINGGCLRFGGWIRGKDSTYMMTVIDEDKDDEKEIKEDEKMAEDEDSKESGMMKKKEKKGMLTMKDIMSLIPYQDPVLVVRVKGHTIRKSLEHSLSAVPALKGQFPQVSGVRFVYDPLSKPMHRLRNVWVSRWIDDDKNDTGIKCDDTFADKPHLLHADSAGSSASASSLSASSSSMSAVSPLMSEELDDRWEPLDDDAEYTFATRSYLYDGGDGFDFFVEETLEILRNEDDSWPLSFFFRNFLWCVQAINDLIDTIHRDPPTSSSSTLSSSSSSDVPKSLPTKDTPLESADTRADLESVERKIRKWGMRRSSSVTMSESPMKIADSGVPTALSPLSEIEDYLRSELKPLRIAPPLKDYRIMTLEDWKEFENIRDRGEDPLFRRLPSFVSMDHRPERRESLLELGKKSFLLKKTGKKKGVK